VEISEMPGLTANFTGSVTEVLKRETDTQVNYKPEGSSLTHSFIVHHDEALNPEAFENAAGKSVSIDVDGLNIVRGASIEGTPVLDRSNDLTL
jgi:hypothetical protein